MEFIKKIIDNELYSRLIRYGLIGGLTTVVSLVVYWIFLYPLNFNPNIANIISIVCAVIFAYIANKKYVFRSKCNNIKEVFIEALSFFSARAVTIGIEILGIFILYSYCKLDAMFSKIVITIIVIILNYIFSRFITFKDALVSTD
jgi:putative flippase GtrA